MAPSLVKYLTPFQHICRDCTGFVYERADCSGFGGPTNTGVCLQIKDSVVSWPAIGSEMGSLNPFAQ
jgi:hypothetical protein